MANVVPLPLEMPRATQTSRILLPDITPHLNGAISRAHVMVMCLSSVDVEPGETPPLCYIAVSSV